MKDLPSQKMLSKFFWAITIILGLTCGIWLSLKILLLMEALKEYSVVYNFWHGIYLASRFISIYLAATLGIIFVMRIIVAILDATQDPEQEATEAKKPKPQKPKPGDPDWSPDLGDLSDFD